VSSCWRPSFGLREVCGHGNGDDEAGDDEDDAANHDGAHPVIRCSRSVALFAIVLVLAAGCDPYTAEDPTASGDPAESALDADDASQGRLGDAVSEGSDHRSNQTSRQGGGGDELPVGHRLVITAESLENDRIPDWLDDSVLASRLELVTSQEGATSIRAAYVGGGQNGYARVQVSVDWREGDTVAYGMRFRLPAGFWAAQQGAVDLMRWDNWSLDPEHPDHGGLALGSDGRLRLIAEQLGVEPYRTIVDGVEVPEAEWVEVRVVQTLSPSPGVAHNEVWVNGERVGVSERPNASGRRITVVRAGLVSLDSGAQREPIELLFDEVTVEPAFDSSGSREGR
jgi:hypothetical protein